MIVMDYNPLNEFILINGERGTTLFQYSKTKTKQFCIIIVITAQARNTYGC